jgi:ribosomal RNA assembly protein
LRIPVERVGCLVGKNGVIKKKIETECGMALSINSKLGEVNIELKESLENALPLKAEEIINAIARGFSPHRAFRLMHEDQIINIIDLRNYVGKSRSALERIKGRIIGLKGKSRRIIEELTGTYISIYGHTVSIIGKVEEVKIATDAINMLAKGSIHKNVYNVLQRTKTEEKVKRLKLWEDA